MLKRSLRLYPIQALLNALPLFNPLVFQSGNVAAGKGYDHVPTSPNYPRGDQSEIVQDLEGQSRAMT